MVSSHGIGFKSCPPRHFSFAAGRHIAGTKWGLQQYLKMDRLGEETNKITA